MTKTILPDTSRKDFQIKEIQRSETIPASWYTHPGFLELENKSIFSETWQYAGSLSQLQKPGDYILASVADNPILIIRGKDDVLRAFYNVCRHRAGPLAIEPQGHCNILQCKYHGWTYLLDGSLRGTPKFDRTELFDRKNYGLMPVKLDTWQNLVFVNLSKGKQPSLSKTVEGIVNRIHPFSIADKKFYKRIVYDVHANWKVYCDNYLEGYHLPMVHPELCNLLDYQQYVTEVFEHYSLQYSPLSGKENIYSPREGTAFYYFIFPNFMLNILPGRIQVNRVIPVAYDRCQVIFDYFYDDSNSPEATKRIGEDLTYSDSIQQEDANICERVQMGLRSDAYNKGRFSPEMEEGVYHFQCRLKKTFKTFLVGK